MNVLSLTNITQPQRQLIPPNNTHINPKNDQENYRKPPTATENGRACSVCRRERDQMIPQATQAT